MGRLGGRAGLLVGCVVGLGLAAPRVVGIQGGRALGAKRRWTRVGVSSSHGGGVEKLGEDDVTALSSS